MLNVSQATVLTWEDGTMPMFCVGYGQLRALADALTEADARVGWELDELLIASQCDLLVTGMLHGFEDYGEVPAVEGESAEAWATRGLLCWALTGAAQLQYRPHVVAGRLLAEPDVAHMARIARELQALEDSPLSSYGTVLLSLTHG